MDALKTLVRKADGGGHHPQGVSKAESCGRNSERQNPFKLSPPVGRSSWAVHTSTVPVTG